MELLALIAAAGLAAVLAISFVSIYNALVELRQNIEKSFGNIDIVLQQRHAELVKLVEACKGYMGHERELLERLARLRGRCADAKGSAAKAEAENALNASLLQLRGTWESYPDLKASRSVVQLQERISALESAIADRREFFNDSVNIYNTRVQSLPDAWIAGLLGFRTHPYLEKK